MLAHDYKNYKEGLLSAGGASILWGLLPLYWKLLSDLNAYTIFSHRVLWSFVFLYLLFLKRKQATDFTKSLFKPELWKNILPTTILISMNWIIYIWAVNHNQIVEASLGYFMTPLVLTFIGSIFYKERLDRCQIIGILLAILGISIKTIHYGKLPFVGLILAFSFAFYGLFKRKSKLDALNGLAFETFIVSIPSFAFIFYMETYGYSILEHHSLPYWLLVMASGAITAIPLLLYGIGAQKLPLTVLGFLQYIAPALSFLLGIFVFKEPFALFDLLPFLLIWIALVFFSYSQYQFLKKREL